MFFLYWYCTVNIAHAWSLIEHVIRLEHPLQGKALESWAGHCTTRSVTWHGKDSIKSIYLKAEEIVTNKMYYKSFSPLLRALFCCLLWHVSQSRSLPFQFWSKLKQDFAGNFKWIASFGSGFCLFCFSLNLKQRHLVRSNAYTEQWPWWDAVETETTAQTKAEHSGAMMFRCFDVLHSFVAWPRSHSPDYARPNLPLGRFHSSAIMLNHSWIIFEKAQMLLTTRKSRVVPKGHKLHVFF